MGFSAPSAGPGFLSPVNRTWVSQPCQQVMGFSAPSTGHGFLSPVNKSWVSQPRVMVSQFLVFLLLGAGRPCRYDRILFLFDWGGAAVPLRQNLVFVCLGAPLLTAGPMPQGPRRQGEKEASQGLHERQGKKKKNGIKH